MNPLAVETALKSAFQASAFPNANIYTGTSYDELTPESLNLIISVADYKSVNIGLYTAETVIRVVSPALLGQDSYSEFSNTLQVLKTATTQAYLLANWPKVDAPNFCGSFFEKIHTGREQHCWTAELTVMIGIMD